ncbi:uncharacterized protein [Antedon mediterranea]|uniref:uncharacterized protein n=1 Tax=Antedon mediterranea TaxID=105859 RepID=UPI003AF4E953
MSNFMCILLCVFLCGCVCGKYTSRNKDYEHECLRTFEYPPQPKICHYTFVVEWVHSMSANCFDCPFNIDDCFLNGCVTGEGTARALIATNGLMPGPSIQVCQWDTIRVKVINNLQDYLGVTIHWHGMYQTGTNWMDGSSMITHCPIAPAFVYTFVAYPPGTHWWHGHSGFQRSDGFYDSIVI